MKFGHFWQNFCAILLKVTFKFQCALCDLVEGVWWLQVHIEIKFSSVWPGLLNKTRQKYKNNEQRITLQLALLRLTRLRIDLGSTTPEMNGLAAELAETVYIWVHVIQTTCAFDPYKSNLLKSNIWFTFISFTWIRTVKVYWKVLYFYHVLRKLLRKPEIFWKTAQVFKEIKFTSVWIWL